ncbi:sec1 family domain-containing protein 2 isoform X2 [Petromyzon marinus]|uniref:sec1 family domain-containing protein 2 isoform X2 n=1 Tax=Petromyzon marinus TaxID=7757 RepID=UPI003F72874C
MRSRVTPRRAHCKQQRATSDSSSTSQQTNNNNNKQQHYCRVGYNTGLYDVTTSPSARCQSHLVFFKTKNRIGFSDATLNCTAGGGHARLVDPTRILIRHRSPVVIVLVISLRAQLAMSAAGDLAPLALAGWRLVLSEAQDAAVFVDEACAESLHWTGGVGGDAGPWRAGAAALRAFPGRRDGVQQQQQHRQPNKVVFALSSPVLLGGRVAASLRDVVSAGGVHQCVVFTSVSHTAHLDLLQQQQGGGGGLGVSAAAVAAAAAAAATSSSAADSEPRPVLFELLEQNLRQWMSGSGGADCTARVLHAAGIALCPLASGVVLAPASASLFPLVPSDLNGALAGGRGSRRGAKQQQPQQKQKSQQQHSLNDVDVSALPAPYASSLRLLAWWLDSALRHLGVREECFAVGPTSRLLANELASLPPARARRKGAPGRASLVLVDRTLDLAGAVGHHGDSLAERILGVLPRLPGMPSDVAVSMAALTSLRRGGGVPPREVIAPGCLAQPSDGGTKALWEAMLYSKQKEAVMEVRRQVVERAGQAGLVLKMAMGKVTGEQLESYARAFPRGDAGGHAALLQLVLATAQTLEHPAGARRDALLASERLLLQILKEGDFPRVLGQLRARIKPRDERREGDLQPADILQLLVFVYSLIGSSAPGGRDQEREEAELKEALCQVLAEQGCLADTWRDVAVPRRDNPPVAAPAHEVTPSLRLRGVVPFPDRRSVSNRRPPSLPAARPALARSPDVLNQRAFLF